MKYIIKNFQKVDVVASKNLIRTPIQRNKARGFINYIFRECLFKFLETKLMNGDVYLKLFHNFISH